MSVIATGCIESLTPSLRAALFERAGSNAVDVEVAVRGIIEDVRNRGDTALRAMAESFDGVVLEQLEVPRKVCEDALASIDPAVRAALQYAANSIATFHRAQMPADFEIEVQPGVRLGRRAEPLDSVGVYAPGGRAAYPSSVLMGVIPARVAGVLDVIVCSPPGADGFPSPVVLAACVIAGAHRVFAVGGAGAVAALALGTESIPAVARVIGPGNAYVMEAKRQLTGVIAIDSPAGPSEVLIIADTSADPELIAAELIAQAEHDPDAAAVAVIIDAPALRIAVLAQIERLLPLQPRQDIIRMSLSTRGALLDAQTLDAALAFAEEYAPEHLSLMIEAPRAALPRVRRAGTIFLGASSSVAFGDYVTGANHVLPTNRLARSYSGLSTLDFLRFATYQEVSAFAAADLAAPARVLANAEGLPAHAYAAELRGGAGDMGDAMPASSSRTPRLRTAYRDIRPYEPGRSPCAVDLSDNTNLHGIPPAAANVLAAPAPALVTRYPTVYGRDLTAALAERHGVPAASIVNGCGSDDILDAIMRAFCDPSDAVAFATPTFGVVDLFARMNSARSITVPHLPGHALDVQRLVAASAAVTYVCRPNNPTGIVYERGAIDLLAASLHGVLVIDEAYADYAGEDVIDLAMSSERVIVVRTLSKAFGLAGLRIGYAVASPRLALEVEKARGPYKVGGLAEAAAIAALRHDRSWVDAHVGEVLLNRDRLFTALAAMGFPPIPSAANFLLVPVPVELGAVEVVARLRRQGIAVRAFPDLPGIGDAIRVTIGPWPLMERFMTALATV
ncbi:MAG: histidinol dehydrogenase [Longimicrobiales bacterium]